MYFLLMLNLIKLFFMKDRIRQVMENIGLSQKDFAIRLGISEASLSNIYTGRTNPTNNHVQAIHRAFPMISVNWLMFGEGEMMGALSTLSQNAAQSVQDGNVASADGNEAWGDVSFEATEIGVIDMPSPVAVQMVADGKNRPVYPPKQVRNNNAQTNNVVKKYDNPYKSIKEIRVFFDDGTYEAFVPAGK